MGDREGGNVEIGQGDADIQGEEKVLKQMDRSKVYLRQLINPNYLLFFYEPSKILFTSRLNNKRESIKYKMYKKITAWWYNAVHSCCNPITNCNYI